MARALVSVVDACCKPHLRADGVFYEGITGAYSLPAPYKQTDCSVHIETEHSFLITLLLLLFGLLVGLGISQLAMCVAEQIQSPVLKVPFVGFDTCSASAHCEYFI